MRHLPRPLGLLLSRAPLALALLSLACDPPGGDGAARAPDARPSDQDPGAPEAGAPDARTQDARITDALTADARVRDGAPEDGAPEDGAPEDGAPEDGAPEDGALGPDGRPPDDGPPPIVAAANTWSWIPIDGMRCATGDPTGVGVNPAPGGARRLMIYLIGGGACWDAASCYQDGRAAFMDAPFRAEEFSQLNLSGFWFFNRAAPENPFADHHQVFVPYCTGDLHAGDRIADYGGRRTHHLGAPGFEALAARLHATWPDLERVILVGGSAGGYGALLNWHRARAAFPGARVDMINDAGAPIPAPHFPAHRQALWSAAWGFERTLPADCPACLTDWGALIPYNLDRDPTARGALLTGMRDGVIADYMTIGRATFQRGVEALLAAKAHPRFGAFLVYGEDHVLMAGPYVADGQTVPAWIGAMQADAPGWGTVGPSPLPVCDTLDGCEACAVCASQRDCAGEYQACDRLPDCVNAVVCALGCAAADQACIAGCVAAFPRAGEAAVRLYDCARCRTCPGACGACP